MKHQKPCLSVGTWIVIFLTYISALNRCWIRGEGNWVYKMEHHHEEDGSVLQELIKFLKEYFEIDQKKAEVQKFSREHPVVTIFLMVTIAMCAVPIILFAVFVVGSIMFSFLGFLFVEGKWKLSKD